LADAKAAGELPGLSRDDVGDRFGLPRVAMGFPEPQRVGHSLVQLLAPAIADARAGFDDEADADQLLEVVVERGRPRAYLLGKLADRQSTRYREAPDNVLPARVGDGLELVRVGGFVVDRAVSCHVHPPLTKVTCATSMAPPRKPPSQYMR